MNDSPWDDEGCIEEHQRFVGAMLGAPNGVVILDEAPGGGTTDPVPGRYAAEPPRSAPIGKETFESR